MKLELKGTALKRKRATKNYNYGKVDVKNTYLLVY